MANDRENGDGDGADGRAAQNDCALIVRNYYRRMITASSVTASPQQSA
jgi:hypothetical protein